MLLNIYVPLFKTRIKCFIQVRSFSPRSVLAFLGTCVVVSVTVRRPRPVLVETQAIRRDGRRPVVAQRGRAAGPAVHILHVHAAVAAGQVVLTHPAERNSTHKCATLIYSFHVCTSAQTGIEP